MQVLLVVDQRAAGGSRKGDGISFRSGVVGAHGTYLRHPMDSSTSCNATQKCTAVPALAV